MRQTWIDRRVEARERSRGRSLKSLLLKRIKCWLMLAWRWWEKSAEANIWLKDRYPPFLP